MKIRPAKRILQSCALLCASLFALTAHGQTPEAPANSAEAARLLREYLDDRASLTGFSGAVLVSRGGETLLRAAYGMADYELGVANTPDHIFRIGSLTKPITAVAVLILSERGSLRLNDSICVYLADCPSEWGPVTIETLLSQTSGIPDLFGEVASAPVTGTRDEIDRVIRNLGDATLVAVPGSTYRYTNFNYMLLGYAIEVASGMYWEDFLKERIFEPLSMSDTRYDDVWEVVDGRAHGYELRGLDLANIAYDDHSAFAAGGLRSTLDDLRSWHDALTAGRLLTAGSLSASLTPRAGPYGYGWQVVQLLGHPMHNHSGGISGYSSHLAYYPAADLLIIVLSNIEQENAKGTACDLASLVFGETPAPRADNRWLGQSNRSRCKQTELTRTTEG